MLKCGACRLVYYCSVDCQKAARSKHKVVCLPKRNMDDVMGLSVGSFAEDEACSWVKSTVRQWRDDHAGVLELVRYLGCLPLAIGLASAHAGVHGTARPGEFLAALKRVAPPRIMGSMASCSSTTQRLSAGLWSSVKAAASGCAHRTWRC